MTDHADGTPGTGPGLAAAASRGAVVTLGSQVLRLLVQLAGIVVLARLLAPEDYGLIAVVTVVVGLGELFRDFGLSSAAVQATSLTTGQRDNLFWLNTGIGLALTLLLCAAAPLLALGFGDDRLTAVAMALSATFLLNGISTQYRAMHVRHLRFGRLALTDIGGQLAGLVVGIALAVLGAGYWALVAQQLTQGLVAQVLLMISGGWLPGRITRTESVRPFIGYGLPLLGSQLLTYAASNVDTLVLGARLGPSAVGLYNRAFQLVAMPLLQVQAPATRVALPVLSRLRGRTGRFADFLCFGQVALLTLIGGLFAVLFAQAPAAVGLALGPQWTEAVPIFRVLVVAGFFQAATYAVYWVFLAEGLTRSQLRYSLATRPVMAAMVVIGSSWGMHGVAVAYLVGRVFAWPVALLWIGRVPVAPVRRMFLNGLRSGLVCAVASAASFLSTAAMPPDAHVARLGLGTLAVVAAVGLVALVWPAVRRDLLGILALRRHVGPTRAGSAAEPAPDRLREEAGS